MGRVLSLAKKNQRDEFYTQLKDIEKELRHYTKYFTGKTIYCNCDHPYKSQFVRYFINHFNEYGIKKLVVTCYCGLLREYNDKAYYVEVNQVKDPTQSLQEIFAQNNVTELHGDRDFRSEECMALLDSSDLVVTNPPFSLMREYIDTLIIHNKQFVIISNQNAITCRNIFHYLLEKKLWFGYYSGGMEFTVPDEYNAQTMKLGNICWFTNLDIKKEYEILSLTKVYKPKDYPFYDNYHAINVNKTVDIPKDYYGVMGVPITFLPKMNPNQFELLGISSNGIIDDIYKIHGITHKNEPMINGKPIYQRIFIKKKLVTE